MACGGHRRRTQRCDVDGAAGAVKPCGPGFGCVVTGTATTGLCNTPIATGAECDYNEQCDQGNGFYCKSGALATDPSTCNLTETSGGPSCTYPAVCDSTTSKCLLPQAKLCL